MYFCQCASTGTPSGGPRDTSPPVLDTARSAQNRQTNFKPHILEFYFDEFVEVQNPIKEVLVSPPLTYIPQVKNRGKKVTFTFDDKEILRDDATYTINFGESVVDYHESNKLSNFNFVFGTGAILDSMILQGKIIDALKNEPDQDMVVFLYDNISDSIVAMEKPFYFARPDKTGKFEFRNVKTDTFRLIAIKDENLNYKYDLPTEKVAFYDSIIILKDSLLEDIVLYSSLPVPTLKIISSDSKTYGKLNILCNTRPQKVPDYTVVPADIIHSAEISGDSVNMFYETSLDSFKVIVLNDTILIKPRRKNEFLRKSRLKLIHSNSSSNVLPKDSILFSFNFPLRVIDFNKIIISDTIGQLDDVGFDLTIDKKSIIVRYPWDAGKKYFITLDSGIVNSIYGLSNDSLGLQFSVLKPENTASMNITVTNLDSNSVHIVNILKDKEIIHTENIRFKSEYKFSLKGIVPDKYNVEIIRDINQNGKWDAGDYWAKRQPEPYKFIPGESIRENRETDIVISWVKGAAGGNEPKQQQQSLPLNIKK